MKQLGVQYISTSFFVEIKIWVIGEKISRQFDFLDDFFKRIHHGLLRVVLFVFFSSRFFWSRADMLQSLISLFYLIIMDGQPEHIMLDEETVVTGF